MPGTTLTAGATRRSDVARLARALTTVDFEELLSRVRDGDEVAFAALWRALNPPVVRFLRIMASDAAEDLAAETWIDVVRGLARFNGDEAGFRAWVFTIARHRHLDWCRARARRPTLTEREVELELLSADDDPTERAETSEATAQALKLIGSLPPEQAEVVALRVIADLDVRQVAAMVNKRPGTVRVLAHRGLRRLAQILDREEIAPQL